MSYDWKTKISFGWNSVSNAYDIHTCINYSYGILTKLSKLLHQLCEAIKSWMQDCDWEPVRKQIGYCAYWKGYIYWYQYLKNAQLNYLQLHILNHGKQWQHLSAYIATTNFLKNVLNLHFGCCQVVQTLFPQCCVL